MSDQSFEHVSPSSSDARYFPRWEVDERALCLLDGEIEAREGKAKDISCAGACIVGDWQIAPHQKVQLTIQLAKGTKIRLNGYIRWVKSNKTQREMGVTFYDTSDEIQDLILQHAFEVDKKKVINQWYKGWESS